MRLAAYLLISVLLTGATRPQPQVPSDSLHDAFARVRWVGYYEDSTASRMERMVTRAARIMDNFPYRLAAVGPPGTHRLLLEGWSSEGTGFAQISYWVYQWIPPDSVRVVWRALAAERSGPGTPEMQREDPPYEIRSCLFRWGQAGLAYAAWGLPAPKSDRGNDPPMLAAGYYTWSEGARTFVRVREADAALRRQCTAAQHCVLNNPSHRC